MAKIVNVELIEYHFLKYQVLTFGIKCTKKGITTELRFYLSHKGSLKLIIGKPCKTNKCIKLSVDSTFLLVNDYFCYYMYLGPHD